MSWSARVVLNMVISSFSATCRQSLGHCHLVLNSCKSMSMTPVLKPRPKAGHAEWPFYRWPGMYQSD